MGALKHGTLMSMKIVPKARSLIFARKFIAAMLNCEPSQLPH